MRITAAKVLQPYFAKSAPELPDTRLALLGTNVSRDMRHVIRCDLRHRRHVAIRPMVGAYPVLHRQLKGGMTDGFRAVGGLRSRSLGPEQGREGQQDGDEQDFFIV